MKPQQLLANTVHCSIEYKRGAHLTRMESRRENELSCVSCALEKDQGRTSMCVCVCMRECARVCTSTHHSTTAPVPVPVPIPGPPRARNARF